MTDIKHRENILEAIDQLRRRKARPDINRICNFMTRRFAVDTKDTKADLQRCVENDIVLKVEYKGNISYRNAAKKSYGHIKHVKKDAQSPFDIKTAENRKLFPGIVTTAVADLFLEDSDYLDFGVPHTELVRKILSQHAPKFNKKTITELLQREVENGGLIKMENGNFSLGPSQQTENEQHFDTSQENTDHSIKDISQESSEKMDYDEYTTINPSDGSSPIKIRKKPGPKPGKRKNEMEKLRSVETTNSIRLGGRRKRAKKVFDPSDNNLPRLNRKRGRPLGSLNKSTLEKQSVIGGTRQYGITYSANNMSNSPENPGSRPTSRASSVDTSPRENVVGVCSVCHTQGKKGPCDKMIGCRECSNKAHLSCLNTEDGILRMYPDHTWQCPHCKTCVVCFETSDAGPLTVCSICADAYHSLCHEPKILEKPKIGYKWVCNNCQMEPLLTDIKPKMEIKSEIEIKNEDIKSSNISTDRSSPSPPNSNMSSPYIHSPPGSPTPPTLSPQGNHRDSGHNSTNHNPSTLSTRNHINENINYRYFNAINLSDSQSLKDFETDDFDPNIPDASNWTFDDVYNYFVQYFPEEAIVFKEQEIDGHSLLLMKRVDVLTSLNLKLGPALKIYRHVLKLQVRRDDHKLYWL